MRWTITAAILAMMALVGCTLTQSQLQPRVDLPTAVGGGGRLVGPRRSTVHLAIVTRPVGDPVLDEVVWREADPQAIADAPRRALEANGLRVGRVTGELPAEVRALIDAT